MKNGSYKYKGQIVAGLTADAILVWAHAANKSIANGDPPSDGQRLMSYVTNSQIEGATGTLVFDEEGVVIPNFCVGSFIILSYVLVSFIP